MLKANAPLALVLRSLPALFSRTTVPVSREMVPPTEKVGGGVGHAGDRDVGDVGRADGAEGSARRRLPDGLVLTVTL